MTSLLSSVIVFRKNSEFFQGLLILANRCMDRNYNLTLN